MRGHAQESVPVWQEGVVCTQPCVSSCCAWIGRKRLTVHSIPLLPMERTMSGDADPDRGSVGTHQDSCADGL